MSKIKAPIIVEESFESSIQKVWQAITDLDQMNQWFFENIPEFDPVIGFETQFDVRSGERNFCYLWKIVDVEFQKKIVYQWSYAEYEGEGTVVFELEEREESTQIKLIAEGMESFPQDIPEFSRESCVGGWNYFIKERLKSYLG